MLGEVVRDYRIIANWNHMDFVLSINARNVLYNNILTAMNNEVFDVLGIVRNFLVKLAN